MRALVYRAFGVPPQVEQVDDPRPPASGVVLSVDATGLCRSDWHGWMGHDPDIQVPHVPGHELAGTIVETGKDVKTWKIDDRVTLPFVCGCGTCSECVSGNPQVCPNQFQPGFTHWGSFAEYVAIHFAEGNLVRLPDDMTAETAASLGCRVVTSYRAIVDQGELRAGEWVAVHGCGGVGLSAIAIARAGGARIVAVDIRDESLELARRFGAEFCINARTVPNVAEAVRELTDGGAHISVDALGNPTTCRNSVLSLRKRGRHVQIGLLLGDQSTPPIPMDRVVAHELRIIGTHGIQASRYPQLFNLIRSGDLRPAELIHRRIRLDEAAHALMTMDDFLYPGITMIDPRR